MESRVPVDCTPVEFIMIEHCCLSCSVVLGVVFS